MKELQVKDYPDYIKNTQSNAILNSNYIALEERKRKRDQEQQLSNLFNDVDNMKSELSDIKNLLTLLLNK